MVWLCTLDVVISGNLNVVISGDLLFVFALMAIRFNHFFAPMMKKRRPVGGPPPRVSEGKRIKIDSDGWFRGEHNGSFPRNGHFFPHDGLENLHCDKNKNPKTEDDLETS
jgi:hypothetical protein